MQTNMGFYLDSSHSILVVTSDDKLIELECPFQVEVIKSINNMTLSQIKEVTS
jgi:hypothetical protein